MGAGTSAGRQGGRRRTRAAGLRAQGQRLIDRADSLDRVAERWEKGEEGERVVGAALDALQAQGWIAMHDVRWPGRRRANIDHVAIGPPGILVVDAKNWSGTVAIRHGRLKQNGYGRDKEVDGVSRAAGAVGELLDLPWALHVIPVLCLAQPIAVQPTNLGQVTVVQLTDLARWATSLTPRLEPGDVLGIAEHLRGALASASLPAPRQPSTRSYGAPVMRRDRAVPSVKRRRPRSTLRGRRRPRSTVRPVLLKLALLAAVLLAGPALLQVWFDRGDDVVRQVIPSISSVAPTPVPEVFTSCTSLRAEHKSGIKAPGARNQGRRLRAKPTVDSAGAAANNRLDRDGDGLICERVRRAGGGAAG
jgi:hypothetical protein